MNEPPGKETRNSAGIPEDIVFHARDQERRRIARELHDSTSQYLTALRLTIGKLKKDWPGERLLQECDGILDILFKEIRTISFLGHPPELNGHTLEDALVSLTNGFEARAGLEIHRELMIRRSLGTTVEECVYRIVQEALINVHRHAHATKVAVSVVALPFQVAVRVSDNGRNATREKWERGVGLSSMMERAEELGGTLMIDRSMQGTSVVATIPVQPSLLRQDGS